LLVARTLTGHEVPLDDSVLAAFAHRLGGRMILPRAPEYDDARHVWNGLIDRRPAGIVRCSGVADVIESVRFAREHDLLLAVRGGGHNVAGFATCDGGFVVDLSAMRGVRIDAHRRTARAQGGVTWGALDRETQVFGLAVPGGVVSTTGIAGLTLGGGQGWLRRTYGMTCDSLLSADVVTADGEFVTASETERADLFWAIRGGGGNFGIVTDFEYRLHPVGPVVTYATVMYPAETAPAVLAGFRDYVDTAPDGVNASAALWTVPPGSTFPVHLHGRGVIALNAIYVGNQERGKQVLHPLGSMGTPVFDRVEPLPYTAVQRMLDPLFPARTLCYYWKAVYLERLDETAISAIGEAFARAASPLSMLVLWAQGGAVSRVGACETAVGTRRSPFLLEILANWRGTHRAAPNIAWARAVFATMHSSYGDKPNFNFPGAGEDGKAFVTAAFGEQYERLAQVKRKYDPGNLFRVNQNVT
jgi:hypothetical protein